MQIINNENYVDVCYYTVHKFKKFFKKIMVPDGPLLVSLLRFRFYLFENTQTVL